MISSGWYLDFNGGTGWQQFFNGGGGIFQRVYDFWHKAEGDTITAQDNELFQQFAAALSTSEAGTGRYVALNMAALQKHDTVEFRMHSATYDTVRVLRWVSICTAMVVGGGTEWQLY